MQKNDFGRSSFDIILLDVMLPGGSGFDFLPIIRKICDIPVIMLTALDQEDELVKGLNLGADDYITKPFTGKELVARLRAVNRRYVVGKADTETVLGDLELFRHQSMVRLGNTNIELTDAESHIIELLLNARNNFVTREFLFSHVLKRDMTPRRTEVSMYTLVTLGVNWDHTQLKEIELEP